ncbi:MAG: YeeE/YedE family protein [Gammaproteobacteria bacterium]|nr:YeeE/YedE family protein [Gammaproteobacteria bacterium]MBU1653326.1 YeeE/YedE family protein [Gammaproteobacteria bacterium]MBU1962518.1 YeeE/YedE family protein [Gammaproteobacteria bacterium]
MSFETFAEAQSLMLWATFALALVMGALVNKTNFCTMGAVSDAVNMGDYGRIRAWLLAIAVAVIGVAILESLGLARPGDAFPPYRGGQLLLAENILGGLMFGIGMTLASGCGNKVLIRIGGGNIKSIFVLAIIALIAYFMINPFPGSDQTLMSVLFIDWIRPLSINLGTSQDLGAILGGPEGAATLRLVIAAIIGLGLLLVVFKSADFRSSFDNILGGLVVGLVVLGAWYLTSNIAVNTGGEVYNLTTYYDQWDMLAESTEGKPDQGRPLSPQSFTFINPMGQTLGYLSSGLDSRLLTFGVMSLLGVIAGSLLWSILSRSFRIEWFSSGSDFLNHAIGAVLMGFGGVLAMGCTIGQAITGISTLALGSFLTFGAIVLGSALTMKIQYYKMVYEEEATFVKALLTALVDLKLLPSSLRKLDPA